MIIPNGQTIKAKYHYLIVGAGLYGSIMARELANKGKKVLVIDKREHIAGSCYTKKIAGINVGMYGGHIFHTSNKKIWDYLNSFVPFKPYCHNVIANYNGELYNLPFNMYTFHQLWGINTPDQAMAILDAQRFKGPVNNLAEQAMAMVGTDVYNKLIKGYTEKQWNRKCEDLPSFIIKRLPVRYTFDNNYYNDIYQGVPFNGYTELFEKLLEGIEVQLNKDFFSEREYFMSIADKIIFSGRIDEFFDFKFGKLDYRSLKYDIQELDLESYQGCPVMNFTDAETPYTRIMEFKYFENSSSPKTVIEIEYPDDFDETKIPYYPINDDKNNLLYIKYLNESKKYPNIVFGGRLGDYKYYDMDKVIEEALKKMEDLK